MSGAGAVGGFAGGIGNLLASSDERKAMRENASTLEKRASLVIQRGVEVRERRKKQFEKLRGDQLLKFGTLGGASRFSITQETDMRMMEELVDIHRRAELEAQGLIEQANAIEDAERSQKNWELLKLFGSTASSFSGTSSSSSSRGSDMDSGGSSSNGRSKSANRTSSKEAGDSIPVTPV